MHETFDYDSHWVSRHVEAGVFGVTHPLLVSVLKFSLPWNVLSVAYTVLFWEELSLSFLYASALGLLWLNLAPFLIWYYDERVLPEFFVHLGELIPDGDERRALAEKYNRLFGRHYLSVSLFWLGATLAIIYVSEPALRSQGMTGPGELFLWTSYAYAAYVGLVLSHGFVGPVLTVLLVRDLTRYDLEIDPLHPDGLGGLSTVGYVSIRTTLLFSSGSLFIPLVFFFAAEGGVSAVIFGFLAVYVLTILVSFLYPTAIVNRRAQQYRDSVLEDLREQYAAAERALATDATTDSEMDELNTRLELQRIQRKYDQYASVDLYPLQLSILLRLASSVLLPILFMVVELYLPNLI